jgi:hypothetical protein
MVRRTIEFYKDLHDAYREIDFRTIQKADELPTSFHIHNPGDKYHVSRFTPYGFFKPPGVDADTKMSIILLPSGVIRQPESVSKTPVHLVKNTSENEFRITKDEFIKLNRNVVYPTKEQYTKELETYPDPLTIVDIHAVSKKFNKSVDTIMKLLGPGIY